MFLSAATTSHGTSSLTMAPARSRSPPPASTSVSLALPSTPPSTTASLRSSQQLLCCHYHRRRSHFRRCHRWRLLRGAHNPLSLSCFGQCGGVAPPSQRREAQEAAGGGEGVRPTLFFFRNARSPFTCEMKKRQAGGVFSSDHHVNSKKTFRKS